MGSHDEVTPSLPLEDWGHGELLCRRFEQAWQRGDRPDIALLLGGVAEPLRSTLLRELLLRELHWRRQAGERPEVSQYLRRFPQDAALVKSLFSDGEAPPHDGGNGRPSASAKKPPRTLARMVAALVDGQFMSREGIEQFLQELPADERPRDGRQLAKALHRHRRLPKDQIEAAYRRADREPGSAADPAHVEPQARLEVVRGPDRGRILVFTGHDVFTVGRSNQAQFQLAADRRLSRFHFVVEVNPPRCRLYDLDSRNGTFVNGARVQAVDLRDGDRVQAGSRLFELTLLGPWQPAARRDTDRAPAAAEPPPPASTQTFRPSPAAAAPRPQRSDRPPEFPGYRIERELGRGGMGVVYLATRLEDHLPVALKTLRPALAPDAGAAERFLRECEILQQLRHPHIVSFLQAGQWQDLLFFVMEYVAGTSARQVLQEEGPLPVRRAVSLICQALDALEYAHTQGYVHRDVNPANLLIGRVDGRETCKLADFGLARAYQASSMSGLTLMGDIGGTVPYMPPEQITHYRESRPAADQYATAATLYHLLSGEYIFDFGDLSCQKRLGKILMEEPVPLRARRPDVPTALADAIHRALTKDPGKRFPSTTSFRKAIERYGEGQ